MNKKASSKGGGAAILRRSPRFQAVVCSLLLASFCFPLQTQANPHGGVVVHGDVQIGAGTGGNLQILQDSQNAIIDWQGFSISAGELTQFLQPGSSSAVLNRVTGGDPSAIHGALQANGNVFLINPSGILVGPSGSIDVHGLVLSTLDVDNGEFLARGDMVFKGGSDKGVTNLGRISAIGGDVFLIGRTITNSGTVKASQGRVGLAAGEEVLLKADTGLEGERIFVRATGSGASGTGILNDGTIEGAAVELKAHGNLYALAINNKGSVRATGAENTGGRVFLRGVGGGIANSGSIEASASVGSGGRVLIEAAYAKVDGQIKAEGGHVRIAATEKAELGGSIDVSAPSTGGSVIVEAREIVVGSTAQIDASGTTGGGSIQIGGGFQGRDATIRNAESLVIDDGATIRADALASGNGGEVILWSDGDTTFRGSVSAQALGNTGNGGFVEVSGKEGLLFDGTVSTLAGSGANGTLLLDPRNLTISTGTASATNINSTALATLVGSNHVVVSTYDTLAADAGHITVLGSVIYTSDNSLTLLAEGDIYVGNHIINRGAGDVNLVAGWDPSVRSLSDLFGGSPGSPGSATVAGAPDMDSLVFDTAGSFGKGGGSVYVGLIGAPTGTPADIASDLPVSVGSRTGQTNVAGHDVMVWGAAYSHADPYRHSQIGYNPRDANTTTTHYDATGRIRVKAVNDVQLVSNKFEVGTEGGYWPDPGIRTGNAAFAQIGHGGDRGSVIDMNFSGAVIVEAGRDVTLKGGKAYNDYAQIGHGGYVNRDTDFARVTSISGGAITVTATTGNVTLLGGTGFHASAHIGHGGTNIILSDFVESAINVTAGGNVTVQGGAGTAASNVDSSSAHAQIGHGGYNADFVDSAGVSQVPGSGYGYKGEITVDAGGAVFVTAGNYDASSYAVIGHGGGLSDGDHSGNVTVTAKTGIALKGGAGAVALFAQIGHVLYNSTNALSGSITATTDSGNVLLQGGGSSTTYTMIGHGGQNSVGATSRIGASPITVTATTGDVLLLSGKAGYAGAKIGHGGHLVLLSSFDESSVSVTAGRHIRLVSPQFDTYTNVSYASTQIGHGGVASTVKAADGTVLGYKGTIDVTAGGKIDLIAGRNAGTYNWSLIGHTSFNSSNAQGVHDGNITVKAGTVDGLDAYGVTVQAASGDYNGVVNTSTSYYSFASIGHRGHSGGTILSGDILVDVLQGGVTLQGGNGLEGSTAGTTPADLRLHGASIGHGGFNVISGMSGDIRVHAEGDILLRAGTGPGSPVVIGHGGRDARGPISGLIEVISRNGSLELDSTLSYSTAANIYSITSEDRGTVYIGHGGALAGGSGTRQGDILVDVAGEISLVGDFSFIGHRTTGTVSNSDLTIRARSFDRATGDSGSQLFSLDAGLGAMLATSLGWGHLSLVGMGSQGIEMAGAMSWNSSYDFNLLSYSDIHIASLIANQGSGDVTVVAGWDPAKAVLHTASDFPPPGPSAPAAPWRYYMIRDVNAATDLIGVADSYGNGDAVVTVGSSTAAAAVGTANGTTTVLGHSVEVLGSTTNANAYALIGTQPAAGLARAGAITVMANGGGVAVRGGGLDNTYAGIGHRSLGGTTSPINSAIRVESLAGLSLRGGAGLLSSAQIGHGGASGAVGVVGGAINLKATTDIELIGGGGAQAYAQIGHGGSGTSGTLSGDVTIDQVRNVTLAGGGSHAYAQIGHGGASGVDPTLSLGDPSFAKRALSASGTVQVVNTTGAVSMTGGAGTHSAYVQIGHGGVALSNGGAIGGDVTVEAGAGGIDVKGGLGNIAYALIGSGGYAVDGALGGTVTVDAEGTAAGDGIRMRGGDGNHSYGGGTVNRSGFAGAMIGNGGYITSTVGGDTFVTVANGGLAMSAGNGYYSNATIGHAAYSGSGAMTGLTDVWVKGGNILLEAGSVNYFAFAQIGHGGWDSRNHGGSIGVKADQGNIVLQSGNASTFNHAKIGHGGYGNGSVQIDTGTIDVEATLGSVSLESRNGAQAYTQIGHGGVGKGPNSMRGEFHDAITVTAGNQVKLAAGGALDTFAMIGHGGTNVRGTFSGKVDVTAGAGGLVMTGGTGGFAFAQVGHGGSNQATVAGVLYTITGAPVTVNAGLVDMKGGGGNSYAQIGHGGVYVNGSVSGSAISVTTTGTAVTDGVKLKGGTGSNSYAMIGSGGLGGTYTVSSVDYSGGAFGATGDVTVTSAGGGISLEGTTTNAFALIGNGGTNVRGAFSGAVNVTADAGALVMKGGSGGGAFAQVGHGGYNGLGATALYTITSAPITVMARLVDMKGGGGNAYAQIGHGGFYVNGSVAGSAISVTTTGTAATDGVKLKGGTGSNSYAMIGSGGFGDVASSNGVLGATGDVSVTSAGGGISLEGTASYAYALIGNGGHAVAGDLSGTTTVISNGGTASDGVSLKGGTGSYSFANIGHATNNVTGSMLNSDTVVRIAGGGLDLRAGSNTLAVAAIGLQSRQFTGNRSGKVDVTVSKGDVTMTAGTGTAAFVQIGHGGWGINATGDIAGEVTLTVEDGTLTMTGGSSSLPAADDYGKFALIGHGGGGGYTGPMSGSVTADVRGTITMQGGTGGDGFVQIGHGGRQRHGATGLAGDLVKVVSQEGGLVMNGGDGARTYSMIGHGGRESTGTIVGSVEVEAREAIAMTAGGGAGAFALIGHGGYSYNGAIGATGDSVKVTSRTAGLSMTNGNGADAFAMIGMGGYGSSGAKTGAITVSTVTGVSMNATVGIGARSFVQIGHGGYSSGGSSLIGDVSVKGTGTSSAVTLLGGHQSAQQAYALIGHGGYLSAATTIKDGAITVEAGSGGIVLKGGGLSTVVPASAPVGFAQIGHGGTSSGGASNGAVSVTTRNGGNVVLHGGGRQYGHAQIGHGGRSSVSGLQNGTITVTSAGKVELRGAVYADTGVSSNGSSETFAQIGHGGMFSQATFGGEIKVDAQTGVLLESGASNYTRAQIGHGGYGAGSGAGVGVEMVNAAVTVTTVSGGVVLDATKASGNIFATSMIGNGGTSLYNGGRNGAFRGDITVNGGTGNVELHSGGRTGSGAMIGNGGTWLSGNHSGRISVTADGDLVMDVRTGGSSNNYSRIGHGGVGTDSAGADQPMSGNMSGDICVQIGGKVLLDATGGSTLENKYVQIGHGGSRVTGDFSGNITVVARGLGGIELKGGAGTGAYAQIGHGGRNTNGDMTGNIYVVAEDGDIKLVGGSGAASYAMLGHGDGAKTSLGKRGGGMHIFAQGNLTGTGGSGAANQGNVHIFHQNNNGLQSADYLAGSGDGYQKVVNGTISLPGYVTADESTMISGNLGYGLVQILDSSATDYTINAPDMLVDTSADFYLVTGGNITMLSSYQNSGTGSVTLVAGWNGVGGSVGPGSVTYAPNGTGGFNYCKPIISQGALTGIDFNDCAASGNNGKTLTIGSATQTRGLAVGSRYGANTFAAYRIVLRAGNTDGAYTQLGYRPTATADGADSSIALRVKQGGLTLTAGTGVNDSYVQIGHGGTGATNSILNGAISVTFCAPGDVILDAGAGAAGRGSYAQIGHGGNAWTMAKTGAITIDGAKDVILNAGREDAYAQIGHGGAKDAAGNYGLGDANGAVSVINTTGRIGLYGGTGLNATAQIGHGGVAMRGIMGGAVTVDARMGGIELKGSTGTRSYALIGHGGYNVDRQIGGDVTVNAKGTAAGDGIVMSGGGGSHAGALIGNGGYENNAAIGGFTDVSVVNGGLAISGGGGQNSKAGIGHSNSTDSNTMTGYVKVYIAEGDLTLSGGSAQFTSATIGHEKSEGTATMTGAVDVEVRKGDIGLTGGLGQYSFAVIGHGGRGGTATADGAVTVIAGDGDISVTGGNSAVSTSFSVARIGHGVWSSGTYAGAITVTAEKGNIVVQGGADGVNYNFAQIGHGGYGNGSTVNVVNQAINVTAILGSVTVKGGAKDASFAQIGHAGLGRSSLLLGSFSGDITVKAGNTVALTGGNAGNTHALIGNGGAGLRGPVSGTILVEAGTGGISLSGSTGTNSFAAIGNGGQDIGNNISGTTTVTAKGTNATTDGISLKGGTGSQAAAHIGHLHTTGTGTASGSVEVTTVAGDIALTGGGSSAHAQIGHGGRDSSGAKSGTVIVKSAHAVTLSGGGASAFAQIGHGGVLVKAPLSDNVLVEARTGGIELKGGTGSYSHALIGNGGYDIDNDVSGTTTVRALGTNAATDGIQLKGGNADQAVAHIGHLSSYSTGNTSGSVEVTAEAGDIKVEAGDTGYFAHAQIGHGGRDSDGDKSGTITVTAKNGNVVLRGGGNYGAAHYAHAQIGHGGYSNGVGVAVARIYRDDIRVESVTGSVTLTGGDAAYDYAQIGHGGTQAATGMNVILGGKVDVVAALDVALQGGAASTTYTMIGHGGQAISGTAPTTVGGAAGVADVKVQAGRDVLLTGGGAGSTHAQIGHGGGVLRATMTGKVDVIAAQDVIAKGGTAGTSYVQIGHGGSGAAPASVVGAKDSSAIFVDAGRDVRLLGGIQSSSGSKIGHGHNSQTMTSFAENQIRVDADRNVELVAAQFDVFTNTGSSGTQIGHGGTGATVDGGNSGYKGDIFVNAGGKLDLIAAKNAVTFNYALIGHTAYYNVRGNHSGDITVKTGLVAGLAEYGINIVAANRSDANASSSYYSFAGIGHRGHSNGAGGGNLEGNITVIAERGGLRLKGGDQVVNNAEVRLHAAQIGHGDYNSDGLKIGDIKVCIEGDILLENGNSRQSPVQIGHGGFSHDGNITGSIEVTSRNGSIVLDSSVGNNDITDTQIGHGGHTTTGTFDGNISVSAAGDIRIVGGRQTATYSQIGHGGTTSTGNFSGNVHLMAGGDLGLVGGSNVGGYAMVGHGTATTLTSGTRSGAMKLFVGGSTTLTDNVSGTRLGHGTSTVGGIVNAGITLVTGTLDLSSHARKVSDIANEMGRTGAVAFAVRNGDLTVDGGAISFNHGFDASFVASGNVVMATSVQNSGNGNVGVAAGWDADAGYDAATGEFDGSNGLTLALASGECRTMQTLVLDFAALAADPASWGNNGGVATIGGGAQTAGVAVGSARGTTTVLGDAVKVIGGNAPGSGHALVGFAPVIGVSPTGDITVLAKGGGVAVEGGNVALAYAQIGHRAVGPAIPSLSGAIRVESLGNLSLKGGGGVVSSAQIGHGANSATADLVGEVTVKVSGGIEAIGGNGGGAYSQIGHGGLFAKGSMKDTIKVDAGGDVLLLAPNLAGLAYAKIGHGDDVRGGGGGDGDREGDIEVTSGGSIELRSALVGHVNGDSPATPVAGSHTWIALVDGSGDLLVDPSAGSLIADAASEFSGAEEVRLYVPRRASNQVAAGAKINGETYDGGVSDPWPVQRDDEYTNHILYEDGTTGVLGQRDDTLLGSGPDPVVPARYAFYYDLIEIGTPPPVVVPTDPGAGGNGGSNMGGGGKAPARLDYRRLLPDDRTHDKWRREQEREYSRWGDYGIYYEGYSQYGPHGESVYDWENDRGGEEVVE